MTATPSHDWLTSSQSESHITTDGQSASQSWCQAQSGAQDQIFVTVTHLRFCRCGAPSLTRGRVCHLSRRTQSQSCFTTGGLPPISSSWRQDSWDSLPEFYYFLHLNPYGHNPCVTSPLTRGCIRPLWICLAFVKCTCRTYSMILKILPFTVYTVLCRFRLCNADHAYLI
jgi:hypothetical protein